MAEQTQQASTKAQSDPPAKQKKGRSPLFWVGITCAGCLVLLTCIVCGISILCFTSEDFKETFTESYCESLEEEGIDPDEDPFGICN